MSEQGEEPDLDFLRASHKEEPETNEDRITGESAAVHDLAVQRLTA